MPAALDVNREAVKMLAISVGVREAARQMGLNEDVVRQWSCREAWFAPTPVPATMQKQVVTDVTKPSICLATTISDNSVRARVSLSKVALKTAEYMEKRPGAVTASVKGSQALRNVVDAASKIGGWDNEKQSGTDVTVNVGIIG